MSLPNFFPQHQNSPHVWEFQATGGALVLSPGRSKLWYKPPGISFLNFFLVSGGGGAGGGVVNTNGSGGGGPGVVTRFLVPAFLTPDVLGIEVGQGGRGGASGASGTTGGSTVITGLTTNQILLTLTGGLLSSTAITAGGIGTVTAATAWTNSGLLASVAGGVAGAGGTTGNATDALVGIVTGGGGGGGVGNRNGGRAPGSLGYPTVDRGLVPPGPTGNGYTIFFPVFLSTGGAGGEGGGVTGGAGGPAGIGSGGGGGAGATTTNGAGGNGGDGYARIIGQ